MRGCNPIFYFLVAPLRGRAQCWEFTSVSALKLSRSMSKELSQFCLSVSLFQEGKHSRERGRAAGGRGAGAPARVGGESGRPAGLRPGSPRRTATCRPRRRAARLPRPRRPARLLRRRPPRPARSRPPGAAAGRDAARNFLNDRVRPAVERFWVGERKGKWKKTENFLISLAVRHVWDSCSV